MQSVAPRRRCGSRAPASLRCRSSSPRLRTHPRSFLTRPAPVAAQALQRSRTAATKGNLLSPEASHGPYGDHFWAHVARGVPGRTAGECLDAFLAANSCPVARFSASDRRLPAAKAEPAEPAALRRRASLPGFNGSF